MSDVYPWRDGRTVAEVVAAHRSLLVSIGMIEKGPGHTQAELAAWQKRLGQPVPDEVIELYLAARSRRAGEHTDFPSIELFEISDKDNRWYRLLDDRPHPVDIIWWRDKPVDEEVKKAWGNARGFMLGGTPFFDRLFILKGHASVPNGSVLLTDHESCYPMVIVGRSLSEYLSKLCYFEGTDLISVPGQRERMPKNKVMQFAREYMELNPASEEDWAEWIARAEAEGMNTGYMLFNESTRRLLPIAEAGEVKSLQIKDATRLELESLASAKGIKDLTILNTRVEDSGTLAGIQSLEHLYLYDCGDVDAAPLAKSMTLKDICFLRCKVRGIGQLAKLASLERLRLNECEFDQAEFAQFKAARSKVRLE